MICSIFCLILSVSASLSSITTSISTDSIVAVVVVISTRVTPTTPAFLVAWTLSVVHIVVLSGVHDVFIAVTP